MRARKDLIKHRIALGNQLRANLLAAFPGAVGLFAEIDSPISLTFLTRFPCAERAAWLSEKRVAAWLAGVGYCGRQTPEQLMAHLRDAPAGLTGPAGAACATVTEQLVPTLVDLRARIDALDEAIAETLVVHQDAAVFTSLPRAGTNRAALSLAEIGDCRARFPDDPALAAAAGVAPSTRASGKKHHVVFRHSCDKKLREALIDFAADSRQASPWAANIYQRAHDRVARHPHAVASSPEPGAASSGAAGPTTPPTTQAATAAYNNCSLLRVDTGLSGGGPDHVRGSVLGCRRQHCSRRNESPCGVRATRRMQRTDFSIDQLVRLRSRRPFCPRTLPLSAVFTGKIDARVARE